MKKLLILMICISLISFISANDYIGKQYNGIDIVDTCVVDGFPCSAGFLCNITVSNPDQKLIVLNSPMTRAILIAKKYVKLLAII